MDSAVSDSFQWSSIPGSQTALHQQASMDDLVASSSSRALLAFFQSSAVSAGVMLLDLVVMAMGEMVVGTPSRDASTISTSCRALTWDQVSTSLGSSFSLWGGGVSTTTWFSLLGVEFFDPWPVVSNITWDRRLLTSMVMLTSPSNLGAWSYGGWL